MEDVLQFIGQYHVVLSYLPDERDIPKLPRQWIVNIGYSIIGDEFAAWVKAKVEERNKKLIEERELSIQLDPDIAKAFHGATSVSSK